MTWWGMVLPFPGTDIMRFLAMAVPFRTASGTAGPFPRPMPTLPWRSPTTTMALKLR